MRLEWCVCECECAASKLNLRPWIGPDPPAPASQSVLCSSAKCCCDKAIITMTSRLPSEMKGTWTNLLPPHLPFILNLSHVEWVAPRQTHHLQSWRFLGCCSSYFTAAPPPFFPLSLLRSVYAPSSLQLISLIWATKLTCWWGWRGARWPPLPPWALLMASHHIRR